MAHVYVKDARHVGVVGSTDLAAYLGKPEGFQKEGWFCAGFLKEGLRRAINSAIWSLDGTPSASELARKINQLLDGE